MSEARSARVLLLLECGHESEPPIGKWEPGDVLYCSRCELEATVDELRVRRRQQLLKRWSA